MKQFSTYLCALIFFLPTAVSAQNNCDLQSKIVAEGENINAGYIKSLLAGRPFYKNEEVDKAREQVKSCSQFIGNEQQAIKTKLELKRDIANKLLKYSGVVTIQQDIDEWKKKLAESGVSLEKRLQEKSTSGLFVVLITNVDDFNKVKLQNAAQASLAQKAVKDLVGEHIKKTQKLTDLGELQEVIKSYTSGQPEPIGAALTEGSNFADGYYYYLAQVEVKPLKKSPVAIPISVVPSTFVYNVELDDNYEAQLQAKGVSREHLDKMRSLIQGQLPQIQENNRLALTVLGNEVAKAEKEINFYKDKIAEREKDKANSTGEIKKICAELGIPFLDTDDPDKRALEAKNRVKKDISDLESQLIDSKDREIIPLLKVLEAKSYQDLKGEMAQLIYDGSRNFEGQASSAFEVEELVEVQNGVGERVLESNKIKYIRRLRKIWAFPIAGSNDDFKVVLFGQFKSEKGSGRSAVDPAPNTDKETKQNSGNSSGAATSGIKRPGRIVTGKVVDKRGEELIGASVTIVGTNMSVATDVRGVFKITIPGDIPSAILRVAYTGYETRQVEENNASTIILKTGQYRGFFSTQLEAGVQGSWLTFGKNRQMGSAGLSFGGRLGVKFYLPVAGGVSLVSGAMFTISEGGRARNGYDSLYIWQSSNVQTLLNQPLPIFGKLLYKPAYLEIPLGLQFQSWDFPLAVEATFDIGLRLSSHGTVYNTLGQNIDNININNELKTPAMSLTFALKRSFGLFTAGLNMQFGLASITNEDTYFTENGLVTYKTMHNHVGFTLAVNL